MEHPGVGGGFWDAVQDMAAKSGRTEDISFNPEGIDRVITRLEDLKKYKLEKIKADMGSLEDIKEPQDPVSYNAVSDIKSFKANSDEFTDRYIDRVDKLIENLLKAKLDYLAQEEGIGGSAAMIGKELDQ
ncbi:MAG: hypothetical protein ACRDQB_17210 [Thermocrispum sp.]